MCVQILLQICQCNFETEVYTNTILMTQVDPSIADLATAVHVQSARLLTEHIMT